MKTRTIAIITIAVIIISNTPPAQYFLLDSYHYQNMDKSFSYTETPGSPQDFKVCMIRWERHKRQNPTDQQTTLYRTFTLKPWQFWEWWQYLAHSERFTLPYLNPNNK